MHTESFGKVLHVLLLDKNQKDASDDRSLRIPYFKQAASLSLLSRLSELPSQMRLK